MSKEIVEEFYPQAIAFLDEISKLIESKLAIL